MDRQTAINILKLQNLNPTKDEIINAYRSLSRKYHPDFYQSASEEVKEVMHEKFIQITEAKDFLLNDLNNSYSQSNQQSYKNQNNYYKNDLDAQVSQFEAYFSRRQFNEAANILNYLINQYGETPYLLELRIRLYAETNNYYYGYQDILKLENLEPALKNDPDFQHYKAIFAAESGNFYDALKIIDYAISLLGQPAPTFLATKAQILVMAGRTNEADQIISILERYDPNHPLVLQRKKVYNVGGNYVAKDDAAVGACAACAILECLFDCC